MPRTGRLHIPGGYYHLIGRGFERRFIFAENRDKEDFLSRLGDNLARSQTQCLAWALMSNHYHLLLRVESEPLCKLMAPILGGFAGAYNRNHGRSGYVFQNRYQSILVDADHYLLELIRYIHLNPLRAGIIEKVQELADYRWTGHAGVLGKHRQNWHDTDATLKFFGNSNFTALNHYQRFISCDKPEGNRQNLSGGGLIRSAGGWEEIVRARQEHRLCIGDERILRQDEFVKKAIEQDNIGLNGDADLRLSGWSLGRLISSVCDLFDIEKASLHQKTRLERNSIAKSLVCYWGVDKLCLTNLEIAHVLGISGPAVSYRVRKGRDYCERSGIRFEDLSS